jgi:hypothetical protein
MKDWVVDPEQDVMGESFQSLGWKKNKTGWNHKAESG